MNRNSHREQRGVALFLVLFALLLLSAIGMALMFLADTETNVNNNYRATQQAAEAAIAGLQEVRERMMPSNTAPHLITAPFAAPSTVNAGSVIYVRNPLPGENIQPTTPNTVYFDVELCHENFAALGLVNPGNNVPCPQVAPAGAGWANLNILSDAPFSQAPAAWNAGGTNLGAISYKWVRVNWKVNSSLAVAGLPANSYFVNYGTGAQNQVTVCWDGAHEILNPFDPAPCEGPGPTPSAQTTVFQLTSLAVTPTGARRMAQMEVALDPPFITNAALDTNDFVSTSGSSVTVNGYDNCQCACTLAKGAAVPTCTNRTTGAACTGNTYAIFTSKTISSSGNPAIVAGTNPPTAQNQTYPYDVPSLIQKYSNQPGAVNVTGAPYNMTCSGSPANCGSTSTTSFGTVPNPFPPTDPTNPVGIVNQVTYFPGSVDLQAHCSGAGILVVDGDLTIHGGIDFYGLILVRGVLTFSGSGSGQAVNIIGGVVAGSGSVADSLAGGINMQFDSCALAQNKIIRPPQALLYRELSY